VSALVLDAGALIAVDRGDRAMVARLRVAEREGLELRSTGVVVTQVWRDPAGRQATLARLLEAVDIKAVDDRLGREAGVLLGRAGTEDAVDVSAGPPRSMVRNGRHASVIRHAPLRGRVANRQRR
jgi:hypothetical protein